MKLNIRDLKQQKFVIEAEPSETVADLKSKIQSEKGWEASTQKLIYSGKILQDDKTIESYNIEEKGFVVCMTQKAKAAPAATTASSSSAATSAAPPATPAQPPAQTPAAPPAPAPAAVSSSITDVPATPTPASTTGQTTGGPGGDSSMALGQEREAAVQDMLNMGFERADIDRAMRAAFFNPDRAVEYLLNGIPAHLQRDQASAPAANQPSSGTPAAAPTSEPPAAAAAPASGGDEPINLFEAAAQAGQAGRGGRGPLGGGQPRAGGGDAAAAAGGIGNLDFLRNNPQFQQLRQLVQQQPQMLEPILQQVGAGNPQLAQLIANRPEEFLQLLAEDQSDDAALPPGAQAISVTEEERDAIDRLCRLGFERDLVIQAYFACDKNEELAANFLFDQPEDDDPPQ